MGKNKGAVRSDEEICIFWNLDSTKFKEDPQLVHVHLGSTYPFRIRPQNRKGAIPNHLGAIKDFSLTTLIVELRVASTIFRESVADQTSRNITG
jgi:hypothetical protein